MDINFTRFTIPFVVALLSFGIISVSEATGNKPECRIVFDAGSSGTRLYIYERVNTGWRQHEGPKVGALADPVREIRGVKWSDLDAVITDVMKSLDQFKQNGPVDKKKRPRWMAFDWSAKCNIVSANVYATAGMRIAEQLQPKRSKLLWRKLSQQLSEKLGKQVTVSTRTLTGFEEGLYAWLSVREERKKNDFGIVEMGGASSQVTFPCPTCQQNGTGRDIMLGGKPIRLYSYSFLGLGGDEAAKVFGIVPACVYGAGKVQPQWTEDACGKSIRVKSKQGFRDPYNMDSNKKRGIYQAIPLQKADISEWVLTGAFQFMQDSDVNTCCKQGGNCFKASTSCFRAVYYKKFLRQLGIASYKKAASSWTLGAVICEANNCLRDSRRLQCRWLGGDCL